MRDARSERALARAEASAAQAIKDFKEAAQVLRTPEVQDAVERLDRASARIRAAIEVAGCGALHRWLSEQGLRRYRWNRVEPWLVVAGQPGRHALVRARDRRALRAPSLAAGLTDVGRVAEAVEAVGRLRSADRWTRSLTVGVRATIRGLRHLANVPHRSTAGRALAAVLAQLRADEAAPRRPLPGFVPDQREPRNRRLTRRRIC
jgi:hypothetical protein